MSNWTNDPILKEKFRHRDVWDDPSPEEIAQARREAADDEKLNDAEAETDEQAKAVKPIKATPFDPDKWKHIPRRQWLYGGHYIRGYVTGTSAPSKQGKSTISLAEDVSMMTGLDLLGVGPAQMPPRPLKVWVWNGEDPEEELVRRLKAICLHYDSDPASDFDEFELSFEDLRGKLYLDSGRDTKIKIAAMAAGSIMVDRKVIREITATIKGEGIDVMSLDPLKSTHRVAENSEAMDDVIEAFKDIADETGCAIEHVHHTRKGPRGEHEVSSDDSRGSTSILAAWRDSRVVNVMDADTAKENEIGNRFRYIRMESDRPNMTVRGEGVKWYYLESVSLDNSDAEGPPDSVGIVVPWSPPTKTVNDKATDAQRILTAVLTLIDKPKRITKERGGDYTIAELIPWLKREHGIKATRREIAEVLNAASEDRRNSGGDDAVIHYPDDNRGKAGYRRIGK